MPSSDAGYYQHRYIKFELYKGSATIKEFCERLDVLLSYMPYFPPHGETTFKVFTTQEKQEILFMALPRDYIITM